jgi:type I restriction enzyme R subunit
VFAGKGMIVSMSRRIAALLYDEIETTIRQVIDKALVSEQVVDVFDAAGIKKPDISILSEEFLLELKDIVASDDEAKKLGLTDFEYAFYTAVANNDSAKALMQHELLRELAVVLTQRVRQNATIDWTIKESVRAKLKVIVKRTLRQFGYPPDMQLLATETVLKQAEIIANELAYQ